MPMVWVPVKKRDSPHQVSKKGELSQEYSDNFKLSVMATYLQAGRNSTLTAKLTGVSINTLKYWKKEEWWLEAEQEIKDQSYQQTNNKLQQIIDKSMDAVMDRLEKGDFILDSKTGKIKRVPMKGAAINRIVTDNITKKVLLDNIQSQKVERKNEEKQQERLVRLAESFAKIATKGKTYEVKDKVEILEEAEVKLYGQPETVENAIQALQGVKIPKDIPDYTQGEENKPTAPSEAS